MARPTTYGNSSRVATLVAGAAHLLASSLAPSSRLQYQRSWSRYTDFCKDIQANVFPATVASIAMFIAHLASPPILASAATLATHISAISYFHKLASSEDPTNHFLIRKNLKGATKSSPTADQRVPISPPVLHSLVQAAERIACSPYEAYLAPAVFTLMFHAFLRLGEVTASPHNLQYHQAVLSAEEIAVTFTSYKHSKGQPITLVIPAAHSQACLVSRLQSYF